MANTSLKTLTLGCKVNQYETEFVRQGLLDAGYSDAPDDQPADLCIVNTCTVTNEGDSKSRQAIRKLSRQNPDAKIVVMGCYATRDPQAIAELPGVVEVVTDKRELPDLLGRFGVVDIPNGISTFGDRHRAYVKVQDGCLLRCSYCIIPKVRPEMYSRSLSEILDEIRRLVDNGYREIVLTGIHLGHYGVDWNFGKPKSEWTRLSTLLREIVKLHGQFRVRLSSIEATEVTRELLELMGEYSDKICSHLHICLQSGSDSVLRRMRRRWGAKRFLDRCSLVRETLDRPAITTDIIVGFPGETDEEFMETCDTARRAAFSKIHMFPFSVRRNTPAATMPGQISKAIKSARGKELAKIESETRSSYFQSLIGTLEEVMIESLDPNDPTRSVGTSNRYVPMEIEGVFSDGELVDVTVGRFDDSRAIGKVTNRAGQQSV
ncbi:MAG: tRNA (N(6)-L-threonylcarbamoyladenosine(37)-C(2))-methylthiotransferase MtaB [Planctomycetales bacterium]|nr:tRNA (N(6)-L-threonylcarbamoyladenosine(37)-C(2))-methylthiotransferase MtaB [Planctomycetales bacterium]